MATKKKPAETEVKETQVTEEAEVSKEEELQEALQKALEEKNRLLMEMEGLQAKADEYEANNIDMEGQHDDAYGEERISYYVPYYGVPEDLPVTVNGERIMVKRGETVKIKRKFAYVIENSDRQKRYADQHEEALQRKFEQQTKEYIG